MQYDDWYIHEEWAFLDDIIDYYLGVDLEFGEKTRYAMAYDDLAALSKDSWYD